MGKIMIHDNLTFPKHQHLICHNQEQNYLHRIIISQLLKAHGSCSFVAKDTKSNGQEWVGEIHWLLPEGFPNETCQNAKKKKKNDTKKDIPAFTFPSQTYTRVKA